MRQQLPDQGRDWNGFSQVMRDMGAGDVQWRDGKAAVYVFNAGEAIERVQKEAYVLYMSENGLGPLAFPSLRAMEEAIVDFGLSLFHAPEGAAGNVTTGGTDSITMALKAARDFARKDRGIEGPLNIVLPRSAHPAFDKAAAVMEIEVRRTPLQDFLADPQAMAEATDGSTVMIVGSAPCFPYGLIDPIEALSELAVARGLWLHVDACVGGYIAPFVWMNGGAVAAFDFELPGVSSLSADLHKYGYCAKGASSVFFRSQALRQRMVFDFSDWPGGRMITPTLAGTRPGGAIAAAYAVMNVLGVAGYRAKQGEVTAARERIAEGVMDRGFKVLGAPQLGILAFTHAELDCMAIWAGLRERGWFTSVTTEPKGLHLMLSPVHLMVADTYLADLDWAMARAAERSKAVEAARYS
ncbi:MAG TPA: pyridoxal-dependent decarboxylase [Caulobacteraceae bacterium]|jgi:glutamate/tyrosine decarboxylase-like PLP-dependent enzyme